MAEGDDLLTLQLAAATYGIDAFDLFALLNENYQPVIYMARPVNPSGVGRPAQMYRRVDIEEAIQKDAEGRLAGST
jgi:hypothetical protein